MILRYMNSRLALKFTLLYFLTDLQVT